MASEDESVAIVDADGAFENDLVRTPSREDLQVFQP
jgi:hypothetical protein